MSWARRWRCAGITQPGTKSSASAATGRGTASTAARSRSRRRAGGLGRILGILERDRARRASHPARMKRHPVFPATARQRGLVAPSKFAHVVYLTPNSEALTGWYKLVFEAAVVFRNEDIAFLTYDEEHHRIALIRAPQAGVHHVAYGFDSLA